MKYESHTTIPFVCKTVNWEKLAKSAIGFEVVAEKLVKMYENL